MKYGLAYYRPDDDGGVDVEDDAAKDQKAEIKIPEDLAGFLKSRGLDPNDPKSLLSVWESRGVEVKNAKDYRKRAQEAEAKSQKGQKLKLNEMVARLDDDDRGLIEELLKGAENHNANEESLSMIAEANVKMTPEILELVKAGPAATKAYLSAIQNTITAGTGAGDMSDQIDERIEKAVRRITGVAADQTQRDQRKSVEKKSILSELEGPRTKTHDLLDMLRTGAEKISNKE